MSRRGYRNEFTTEDDNALARYLAEHNPGKAGRSGRAIYERLEKDVGCWASRHSAQAWQERYRRESGRIDVFIARYQREHEMELDSSRDTWDLTGPPTPPRTNSVGSPRDSSGSPSPALPLPPPNALASSSKAKPPDTARLSPRRRRRSIAEPASQSYLSALRHDGVLPSSHSQPPPAFDLSPENLRVVFAVVIRQLGERYGFETFVVENVMDAVGFSVKRADDVLGRMRREASRAFRHSLGLVEREGDDADRRNDESELDEQAHVSQATIHLDRGPRSAPAATPIPPNPATRRRRQPRRSALRYTRLPASYRPVSVSPPPGTHARTYHRLSNDGRQDEAIERLLSSPSKPAHIRRAGTSSSSHREADSPVRSPRPIRRLRPASSRVMEEEEDVDFGDDDPFKVPHFEDLPSQPLPKSSQSLPKSSQLPPSSQPQPSSQSQPQSPRMPTTPERAEMQAWMQDNEVERICEAAKVYGRDAMMRCVLEWIAGGVEERVRVGKDDEEVHR